MAELTVAIPIYNGARFLAQTIESLLAQTYTEFRLLCLDDGSADDSLAIATRFASLDSRVEVHCGESGVPSSLSGNWNRALAETSTPFLVLAHQDDVYEPAFLETMVRLIKNSPRAFAAHSRAQTIDARGAPVSLPAARFKDRFWPVDEPAEREPDEEIAVLRRGNYVIAPTVIFRMSCVREIGPFDSSLGFVTDWEYWLRGLVRGYTLAGTHRRLVRFRRHPWTATRANEINMRRYVEEISLLDELGKARPSPSRRPYFAVENTLTSDLIARLAAGDRDGAEALLRFGRQNIPKFSRSPRERLLSLFTKAGKRGGKLLHFVQQGYLRLRAIV
jgi:glycosyltransferase involved in cell wall biosynthesis